MRNHYDIICVGGGGAGVMAAVAAAESGATVAIVCKEPVGYGNTRMAVGLTACSGLPGDSREAFIEDMLASGAGLCDHDLVEALVDGAPEAITILESFGHTFIRDPDGCISEQVLTRAGGHRNARTLQSSGAGVGLSQSLRAAVDKYRISLFEDTLVLQLIKDKDIVCGIQALDLANGEQFSLTAGAVVLCTGGGGWLFYPQTSNNRTATGDGYALAFRAGAELADMEQIQALPFSITHPNAYRGLICGEPVVAGPSGRLINGKGEAFLDGNINRMDRAAVVRSMASEITRGNVAEHGGLLLDLQPNLADAEGKDIRERIRSTGIFDSVLPAYGKKAYAWEEPWEVLPTAHYFMGGVRVDKDGQTTVPGLFAAGEVQSGVHGANRLGSVALTEVLVFGIRAGRAAASHAKQNKDIRTIQLETENLFGRQGSQRPVTLMRKLQAKLWDNVGLVRDKETLIITLDYINQLSVLASDVSTSGHLAYNTEVADVVELGFMLDTARCIVTSALLREESRGAHLRSDFPAESDDFRKNIILWQREDGSIGYRLETTMHE